MLVDHAAPRPDGSYGSGMGFFVSLSPKMDLQRQRMSLVSGVETAFQNCPFLPLLTRDLRR